MSAKAKQQRDEWEVKMIGVHQLILEICGETPVQKRSVTRKLQELEKNLGEADKYSCNIL